MTERTRFKYALERKALTGHCPTFELEFFLTLEALGRIHYSQQQFKQWNQMDATERRLHLEYNADTFIKVAEKYHHSAIFVFSRPDDIESTLYTLSYIREQTGDKYFLMLKGDPTFSIPNGDTMMDFSVRMYEDEKGLKAEAQERLERFQRRAEALSKHKELLDGFCLCSDYCFNSGPFFSPEMFGEYIAPYLQQILQSYREMGFYSIKHTDGNIMPIIDQMVQCGPDALHSLDPQGGVSLAEVKARYGDRVALCGNVNCGLIQTGSEEQVIEDVRRSLREGMQGNGYIFCTSNCAYTGMPLERYELVNRIWHEEGIYK